MAACSQFWGHTQGNAADLQAVRDVVRDQKLSAEDINWVRDFLPSTTGVTAQRIAQLDGMLSRFN